MRKIKAIIFDLDDTLYDCTGTEGKEARKRAVKAMIRAGLNEKESNVINKVIEISNSPKLNMFTELKKTFNIKDEKIIEAGKRAFYSDTLLCDIKPFSETIKTLNDLSDYLLILVTEGDIRLQQKKIDLLGIKNRFDYIRLVDIEKHERKKDVFIDVMKGFDLKPDGVVCVGDRINSEIRTANELGMIAVRMLHGRFKDLKPKHDSERPDYEIKKISELPDILRHDLNKLAKINIKNGNDL